jgi:hypothetical protein
MTDNYEFMKSSNVQKPNTPYSSKQWNYVNDINSGVYSNQGQTLLQYDLTSIFNSSRMIDLNSMFFLIPITRVAAFSSGAAIVNPAATTAAYALTALRNNNVNLIHSADISIQGKTIEQQTPYINKAVDFRMLSEMSRNDIQALGQTLGITDLDNPYSVHWNNVTAATASYSGNGVCNNEPFARSTTIPGTEVQQLLGATFQNFNTVNTSLSKKVGNNVLIPPSTTTAKVVGSQNIYGNSTNGDNLMSQQQLLNELKPTFQILNTGYMVWYDTVVVRFQDLFQSMKEFPLSRRFDATVRLFVNTGTVNVTVADPSLTTIGLYNNIQNSTFTATCPIVVNSLSSTSGAGGVPGTVTNIVAGCYVSRVPSATFAGINLSTSGAAHPLSSTRVYYASVELKPQYSLKYIEENRNRKVSFRTQTSNVYTNITAGGSFSTLIQSGVTGVRGLVVLPYVDSSVASSGGFGPGGSPFNDGLSHPLSLLNFQVTVGGMNQLQTSLQYTFENYVEQVSLYESLIGSDLGLSTGLINQAFWDVNRVYFCDLSRSQTADDLTPRTIQLQCLNNNQVSISLLVFTIYEDSFVLDVETGIIKK